MDDPTSAGRIPHEMYYRSLDRVRLGEGKTHSHCLRPMVGTF